MSTATQASTLSVAEKSGASRLASIDIFRGLTMLVMIFVNDLDSVHGLPWWTHHAPAKADVMTYVDMVFPFFLFIVGLSAPIAITHRLKKSPSMLALWTHIVLRSVSLIILGLILANAGKADASLMHIAGSGWAVIALLGAVLFLSVYSGPERYAMLHRWLQLFGFVVVAVMYAIFRRTTHDGRIGWIDGSYPEILGLIGYTYSAIAILYISTRRWLWAPLGWLIALVAFNSLCTAKWITFPQHAPLYLWPFGNGAMGSITMGGIVTSVIFLGAHRWQTLRQKTVLALTFAFSSLLAGWLLTPLGISKIRATPTWCLYSIGAAVLFFTALYWVCDIKKQTRWAFFARPAGSNTLLTYLLPDFYYFLSFWLGMTFLETHFNTGWQGVLRSVVFTGVILALAAVLTKWKVRLQL
jgi:heparan-alpha-glucosaminide N-acetyltransferase